MAYSDDARAQMLIRRYQQKVFALALYLMGGNRDIAYDLAASSFDKAVRSAPPLELDDAFFGRVIGTLIEKSRGKETVPASDAPDLQRCDANEKDLLALVARTLQGLKFDEKAFVLLRDQLNFSFKDIAAVMRVSEADARQGTLQARIRLREKVEEAVK